MFLPLSRLLAEGREDDHVIALRTNQVITFAKLRADVRDMVRKLPKARKVVLAAQDSYIFAVGLLALLHSGRTIILPQNQRPKTLEALHGEDYGMLIDGVGQGTNSQPDRFDPLDPTKCEIVMYTSGSTGHPKEVRKTLKQLETEVYALESLWGSALTRATTLSTVTHQHIYGILFKILWPLSASRPFVVESFEFWEQMFPWLERETCILSSPAHLTRYPDQFSAHATPVMVFSSGGPLPFMAAQESRQRLCSLPVEVYGSTETGGIAHRQQVSEDEPWTRFNPVEVMAVNGVLQVRSPYLHSGGWCPMNDFVQFLGDGRFRLRGRNDRVVKIEGKRVSLPEVEMCLTAHEWINDVSVLMLDGKRAVLGCVVVLNDAGEALRDKVGDFRFGQRLRQDLGLKFETAGLPRQWRFVKQIPQNAQGKRTLAGLRALFGGEVIDG